MEMACVGGGAWTPQCVADVGVGASRGATRCNPRHTPTHHQPVTRKGIPFYRIIEGFIDQAGAEVESVFGGQFKDDAGVGDASQGAGAVAGWTPARRVGRCGAARTPPGHHARHPHTQAASS